MDPRVRKLAKVLVHYSLKLKKGKLVKIRGEIASLPLITACYEEALDLGAFPYTDITIPGNEEYYFKHATPAQMKYISPLVRNEVNKMDALIAIWGSQNTKHLSGVDPKKQALNAQAKRPLMSKLFKRMGDGSLTWVGTQFPTHADAQQAEMSLSEYEDFVYRAGHIHAADPVKHWKKVEKEQTRLAKILNRVDHLHIRSATTDLKMRVKGRKWISCHGTENFPDGELFTSPLEDTVEGCIQFTYPANYIGRQVEDVRLELKAGKVIKESASKNLDYLKAMLNIDPGARRVGEIAVGTNYEITRSTGNTLFDEKIGGSCHMAVGASIPEAGGINKSGIHWDMVCDLKKGGEILADGKVIYKNGKFTI
ncbi:MAG: aminopeptidase [candidate division Zixibacteria bacterium]|nr:aminopeptidase [candidate division Zixibacteria bacterium]